MQRVLDPAQIEDFAQREIPRIRVPDRQSLFSRRAQRLRELSAPQTVGHTIGDYLRLMATVAEAQQAALLDLSPKPTRAPVEEMARAREHGMPLLHAGSHKRDPSWRGVLEQVCESVLRWAESPARVLETCERLRGSTTDLEALADAVLTVNGANVDAAAAPFVMSALQVYWVHLASPLTASEIPLLEVPGVCPVCGLLPVASVVRVDKASQGLRYLHCGLCAAEWHLVRVTCSQCLATQGITYHSIEGGPEAIRAESCGGCHSYRKILYQEKDTGVEPVADDLASLALDLLMSEEGYHRASGNPLLWQ
jgi:FdhE protein